MDHNRLMPIKSGQISGLLPRETTGLHGSGYIASGHFIWGASVFKGTLLGLAVWVGVGHPAIESPRPLPPHAPEIQVRMETAVRFPCIPASGAMCQVLLSGGRGTVLE